MGYTRLLDGNYRHRLDDKDRLTIPQAFRFELGRRFYITRGHDQCLYVLTEDQYQALALVIANAVHRHALHQSGSSQHEGANAPSAAPNSTPDPRLYARAMFNDHVRVLQRHFFGDSFEVVPDAQGRILIPESLRQYAGIKKDVIVVGVGDRLELWSPERWASEMDGSVEKLRTAAQGMGLQG
ncbi:MAG: division/cell wall cluster transcriptional repressor MraZ [Armatimonadota bacterium]